MVQVKVFDRILHCICEHEKDLEEDVNQFSGKTGNLSRLEEDKLTIDITFHCSSND